MALPASTFNSSYKAAQGAINPDDWNYFRAARNRLRDTYSIGQAQNTYQEGAAQNAYARSLGNLKRSYAQRVSTAQTPFVKAGTTNSGLQQNAWSQLAQDQASRLGNATGSLNDQLGGYKLAHDQLYAQLVQGTGEVDWQEAARVAAQAILNARGGV